MGKKVLVAILGIILINASVVWAQTGASGGTKDQQGLPQQSVHVDSRGTKEQPPQSVGRSPEKASEAQNQVQNQNGAEVKAGDAPSAAPSASEKVRPRLVGQSESEPESDDLKRFRRESQSEEEAAILPYYNNFLRTYRLGPEDVISVTVFGLDRYSRAGIVIPPNGVISYPLIGGVFVVGKTVDEVAAEITKRLDEYIIDPKVTVSLERAMSARYAVLGDVAQPGVKVMTRRLTVYEALTEAGGVLRTGDKSKVTVLRRQPDGSMQMIKVDVAKIEKGKMADTFYLVPGDQVLVPGNRIKTLERVLSYVPILGFARIFMGGW